MKLSESNYRLLYRKIGKPEPIWRIDRNDQWFIVYCKELNEKEERDEIREFYKDLRERIKQLRMGHGCLKNLQHDQDDDFD